jgi:type I restriction enzyme S subunit
MDKWEERPLDKLAELVKNPWKVGDEKATYIGLEHIGEGSLRLIRTGSSDEVASNKYRFYKDTFLFGKLRPYFRKLYRPNFNGICSTDIWVVRAKNGNSRDFLFYFFAVKEFIDESYSTSSGTRMPRADWKYMSKRRWRFPPVLEQKAIAEVLSSLDDKIDLLHRQNQTLEAMAETLFRQWFVEEAEEGWEEGTLDEAIDLFDNLRVPLSKMQRLEMQDGVLYPYYGAATIMDYVNSYIFDGEYILLGEDGTVQTDDGFPILQYATGKFWVNNHAHVLQAKEPYTNFFIWSYLRRTNIGHIVTGAVQPKINQGNLKNLSFPKFPIEVIMKFDSVSGPLFDKMKLNHSQIKTLEHLRDTLLPKLMSGEVRVKMD